MTSVVLIVSDGETTRAEGPMPEHAAMTRRAYLHDTFEGLSIDLIIAGLWEES